MALSSVPDKASGDVFTEQMWDTYIRDNLNDVYASRRLAYIDKGTGGASNYTANQTSVSAASDVFSSDLTFTADGTSTYWVEFYCALFEVGATAGSALIGSLTDGGTSELQRIALVGQAGARASVYVRTPYTPTAGSKTLNVRAWNVNSSGNLYFGGTYAPGYLAVYGPDLT